MADNSDEAGSAMHYNDLDSIGSDKVSKEALRVGRVVLAIRDVMDNPNLPNAMKTVVELGTDSRYYVLVIGWLNEQLRADQSIIEARRDDVPTKISERVLFLKRAIRAIDLE